MSLNHCVAPRDVVLVQGDDAGVFLHSQLAQDINAISIGGSAHSLLLEPSGHVVALLRVVRHADTVYTLDVDAGLGDAVVARLGKFVLRAKVTLRVSDFVVHSYWGSGARTAVGLGVGRAVVAWAHEGSDGYVNSVDVVGVDADAPHVGDDAPVHDWHINRIDSHWPHVGSDIEVGDIPASTGVTQVAVSFTKGCYPGQELVERMDSRGSNAPVALRVLPAGVYQAGETVQDNGVDIGTITSVGRVHAIARIKRGHDAGTALSL